MPASIARTWHERHGDEVGHVQDQVEAVVGELEADGGGRAVCSGEGRDRRRDEHHRDARQRQVEPGRGLGGREARDPEPGQAHREHGQEEMEALHHEADALLSHAQLHCDD